MNASHWLMARGIRVLADGESLTLEGLSALGVERASEALAYARENKARLLEELGGASDLPARICLGCGKPFDPSSTSKVYCRASCFNTMSEVLQ